MTTDLFDRYLSQTQWAINPTTIQRWRLELESGQDLTAVHAGLLLREVERLYQLINTPELEEFWEGAQREAAHQRERWGDAHDRGKQGHDWSATVTALHGKAIRALWDGDREKYLHHIITMAAVCANWHARTKEASG